MRFFKSIIIFINIFMFCSVLCFRVRPASAGIIDKIIEAMKPVFEEDKLSQGKEKGDVPKSCQDDPHSDACKKAEDALAEEKKRAQQELENKNAEETAEKAAEPEERVETAEGPNGSKITRTYGKGGLIREVEERRDGSTVVREKDKNGNPVETTTYRTTEGHKRETVRTVSKPDGSRVVETTNHLYNTTSRTVYDQNGKKVASETFDKENNRIVHFERQPRRHSHHDHPRAGRWGDADHL